MAKYHATYGPGSTHGYYEDLVNYHTDDFRYAKQAKERLLRHADETDLLDEARYVRTIENTINRSMSDEDERRALSTAATSDGVFVVPQYLVDEADVYHSYQSALIPQCVQVPDVGYGVALNIPTLGAVTTTAAQATPSVSSTTGQQTTIANENTGVSDSSPSGAYQSTGIVTFAGEVAYSQQLHDRSGPKPYTIDAIITRALPRRPVGAAGRLCVQSSGRSCSRHERSEHVRQQHVLRGRRRDTGHHPDRRWREDASIACVHFADSRSVAAQSVRHERPTAAHAAPAGYSVADPPDGLRRRSDRLHGHRSSRLTLLPRRHSAEPDEQCDAVADHLRQHQRVVLDDVAASSARDLRRAR